MMRRVFGLASLVFSMLILPSQSSAQGGSPQQTKETARQFFSTLARNGNVTLVQRGSRWNFPNVAVTDMESAGVNACIVNVVLGPFEYSVSARKAYNSGGGDRFFEETSDLPALLTDYGTSKTRVYFNGSGNSRDFGYYQNEYTVNGYDRGKAQLDFAHVTSVQQSGSQVIVNSQRGQLSFVLSSEDLAARATFAFEFMRTECDPTAGLAF